MIIKCSKRDEILKRKAEYENDYSERLYRYQNQRSDLTRARDVVTDSVRSVIQDELNDVNLDMDIQVHENYDGGGLYVKISDDQNPHDASKALAWSWKANLTEDGQIEKTSSSWSGFNAVSDENIQNLEEILKAVKILNRLDWEIILNKPMPRYRDYITEKNPEWEDAPDFDRELDEATIEELVGTNSAVKGHGYKFYVNECCYKILKESPKQYTVQEISYRDIAENAKYPMSYRVSKDTFYSLIDHPVEIVELPAE